jgi:hypothetical protein
MYTAIRFGFHLFCEHANQLTQLIRRFDEVLQAVLLAQAHGYCVIDSSIIVADPFTSRDLMRNIHNPSAISMRVLRHK